MPVCFKLIEKSSNSSPSLQSVDDKMREHFNVEPDPENWFHNWYNAFGFCMACGDTVEKIKENWQDDEVMVNILSWIDENYTIDCWRESR